jgi:hypothetical protein
VVRSVLTRGGIGLGERIGERLDVRRRLADDLGRLGGTVHDVVEPRR